MKLLMYVVKIGYQIMKVCIGMSTDTVKILKLQSMLLCRGFIVFYLNAGRLRETKAQSRFLLWEHSTL